jgi:pimeloyl-[acyl-carrier protein] methyl ester esterase
VVEAAGVSRLRLLLLPGMDGTGSLFEPLLPLLSAAFSTQVISYPPDQRLGYAELTELVLGQLPQGERFALLGESFSGPIAAAVAARSAPVALVLACSFVTCPQPSLRMLRPLLPWLPPLGVFMRPMSVALMGSHATPALRTALASALGRVDPAVLKFRAAEALQADALASLAAARCPVLYLQATQDRVISRRCLAEVLRVRPDTEMTAIDGPHFLLQTQPAACAGAIASFLGPLC